LQNVAESYLTRNRAQRRRLRALVARLSDVDLRRVSDQSWTVSATLAHLAFWDRLVLARLEKWAREGIRVGPVETDLINEAALPFWSAMPPRLAAEQAVVTAELVDQKLESLDAAMFQGIIDSGRLIMLDRATHRRDHLDELERILSGQHSTSISGSAFT
jgi:hypothetical protein